jgi:hypothetical protein
VWVLSTAASACGTECRRRFPLEAVVAVGGQVVAKPLMVLVLVLVLVMVLGLAWEGVVIVGLS